MLKSGNSEAKMTLIQPTRGWMGINFPELWRYRELFYFLVWRDIKVRYKQSVLGAAWAIIQPVVTVAVFTVFFGNWAGIPTDDIPQPLFYFSAILPWQLLASGVSKAGASLVASRNLVTKVYFPRLVVPMAPIFAAVLDFGIAFLVLMVMMVFYGIAPTTSLLALPFFLLLTIIMASGVGFWLAGLNVNYRDIGYIIPFLMQIWFFVSPIVYSTSIVPEAIGAIYQLNPMTGVIQGFRWAITGTAQPSSATLIASVSVSLVLLISGIYYFRRMERTFADVV